METILALIAAAALIGVLWMVATQTRDQDDKDDSRDDE